MITYIMDRERGVAGDILPSRTGKRAKKYEALLRRQRIKFVHHTCTLFDLQHDGPLAPYAVIKTWKTNPDTWMQEEVRTSKRVHTIHEEWPETEKVHVFIATEPAASFDLRPSGRL